MPQVLAERAPCFEALKVVSAWAGYYDYNSFDQNAFMGRVAGHDGLVLACGHSGHGARSKIILENRFEASVFTDFVA